MFSYPTNTDNSEAQHSSISIYIPSAGRSFMLEFLLWSSKKHLVRCFPKPPVFWSSAVRTSFSRRDHRFRWSWGEISWFSRIMDHDPICWMLWHHDGFFQNNLGLPFRSRPVYQWTFEVLLISSADSVYFLALAFFWLEIRLITVVYRCFW